ncbi:MAG TPA: sialidase family protein [Candidatus Thermoplasmatota archaeon]|nr:sialidase family protein [Candidatus Thermoplasmatota archaeon]
MRALSLVLVLALGLPALAGCLTPSDPGGAVADPASLALVPMPALACFTDGNATRVCNFEATTTNEQGNEVTIAVNPTNPLNLVAGAKDYTKRTAGDCVWDGIYVTMDGGKTWYNHHVPGSPHLLVNDPASFEPTAASQFWCTTDPVVAFGPDGTCYYSFMAYQADPITSSKTGHGILPQGGLNDWAFNRAAQMVAVSTDGCMTFDYMSTIADGTFPVNFHDKQWIEVGADGTVHVAWLSFFVPGNQYWRSTDKARTWEGPIVLGTFAETLTGVDAPLGGPAGQGTILSAGVDGKDVYVAWNADGGIWLVKSSDHGATFEAGRVVIETQDEGMNATYRSGGMPFLAVDDNASSPFANSVYLVWQDTRYGNRDILFSRSVDGGATWSDPLRVNDDNTTAAQFFPAMSVAPNGIVDICWYDRRMDPEDKLLDIFCTYSLDGGATFAPNLRVTDVSSNPDDSHHQNGMIFIGDYIDMDSSNDFAHPVFVDTRHGVADVFTAAVARGPGLARLDLGTAEPSAT